MQMLKKTYHLWIVVYELGTLDTLLSLIVTETLQCKELLDHFAARESKAWNNQVSTQGSSVKWVVSLDSQLELHDSQSCIVPSTSLGQWKDKVTPISEHIDNCNSSYRDKLDTALCMRISVCKGLN